MEPFLIGMGAGILIGVSWVLWLQEAIEEKKEEGRSEIRKPQSEDVK